MSDAETEPFQLDLLLEPVRSDLQAPEVATSSSRGRSRKRNAEEASSEVPSVSRRRRLANAESAFMQTSYPPACCIEGIVQPGPCLLQPTQAYPTANTMAALNSLPPVYRPQVLAPQIHAQMAAMPSTSTVNSVANSVSLHVHTSPPISLTYPTPVQLPQGHDQMYYVSNEQAAPNAARFAPQPPQRVTQAPMSHRPSLASVIYPHHFSDHERSTQTQTMSSDPALHSHHQEYPDLAYLRQMRDWDASMFTSGPQHRWVPPVRESPSRFEMLILLAHQAAVEATTAVQAVDRTAILIAAEQDRQRANSRFIESLDLQAPTHPIEMPMPQYTREWVNRGTNFQEVPAQPPPPSENLENPNVEFSFPNLHAAMLHIFDRVAPQMNLIRMQPKGMPKSEIDQLQSYRLGNPKTLKEKVCVICQCDFEKRDNIRVLPCEHHYHLKCVDKWLKTNRTCPICRKSASESPDTPVVTTSAVASVTATPHIAVQVYTQLNGNQLSTHHHPM